LQPGQTKKFTCNLTGRSMEKVDWSQLSDSNRRPTVYKSRIVFSRHCAIMRETRINTSKNVVCRFLIIAHENA